MVHHSYSKQAFKMIDSALNHCSVSVHVSYIFVPWCDLVCEQRGILRQKETVAHCTSRMYSVARDLFLLEIVRRKETVSVCQGCILLWAKGASSLLTFREEEKFCSHGITHAINNYCSTHHLLTSHQWKSRETLVRNCSEGYSKTWLVDIIRFTIQV
jgi:hypothetical protein